MNALSRLARHGALCAPSAFASGALRTVFSGARRSTGPPAPIQRPGVRIEPAEPIDPKSIVKEDSHYYYVEDTREPYSVFRHTFGRDIPGQFVVVSLSGTQFKVQADDVLIVNRLPVEVNAEYAVERVLLAGTGRYTAVGRPTIPGASVLMVCEEHVLTEKEHSFKMRRRKRYMRTVGFRRPYTLLRVKSIRLPEAIAAEFA